MSWFKINRKNLYHQIEFTNSKDELSFNFENYIKLISHTSYKFLLKKEINIFATLTFYTILF